MSMPDFDVISEAVNGREAVEPVRTHRPDVALVDLRMPPLNGVGTTREMW